MQWRSAAEFLNLDSRVPVQFQASQAKGELNYVILHMFRGCVASRLAYCVIIVMQWVDWTTFTAPTMVAWVVKYDLSTSPVRKNQQEVKCCFFPCRKLACVRGACGVYWDSLLLRLLLLSYCSTSIVLLRALCSGAAAAAQFGFIIRRVERNLLNLLAHE